MPNRYTVPVVTDSQLERMFNTLMATLDNIGQREAMDLVWRAKQQALPARPKVAFLDQIDDETITELTNRLKG